MLISTRPFSLILLCCFLLGNQPGIAQPDLRRWAVMISDFEGHGWVNDMERIEPGCISNPIVPELTVEQWRELSPWANALISELEALPLAEHHADRALDRLLENGMMRFKLVHAQSDRHRSAMETQLDAHELPLEWVILPMALTGWDNSYYGPGRRAGPWAMDMPTAFSLGLTIRRGWDERHLPERMGPAACRRILDIQSEFPQSPIQQVLAFVQGIQAARNFSADSLDADVLGWLHLLRVMMQVDRNFHRDSLAALWALRDKEWSPFTCQEEGPLFFQYLTQFGSDFRMIKNENPWFTTDSIGLTADRHSVWLPAQRLLGGDSALISMTEWCGWRPSTVVPNSRWQHVVQSGEVLGTIARRCGVRIEDIQDWNALEGDMIQVGQSLEMRCPQPSTTRPSPPSGPAHESVSSWTWHTIKEGESYWSIARQHSHVELDDLLKCNDTAPEALRPGMKVRIPAQ
jgi:LysM repeat protein